MLCCFMIHVRHGCISVFIHCSLVFFILCLSAWYTAKSNILPDLRLLGNLLDIFEAEGAMCH